MFIFNQNLFSLKRKGRKSAAQTPSPAKERIYGSSKNPKGSAASKSAASKITLSEGIVDTLKDKAESFNDKYPSKDVSVNTLKAVMRRGMGAYSKSHRPTITGGKPNSRQAWGFARVNKFLEKKAGKPVKKAYVQDDDLLEKGGTISNNVVQFMKWYVNWLKGIQDKMNIYISIPNEFSQIKGIQNFVFLDLFEKKDQSVSAKSYLKEITDKADELGVTIVLEPIPRNNNVSKQYLIDYYSMLGFKLDENGMMIRIPNSERYENGGKLSTQYPVIDEILEKVKPYQDKLAQERIEQMVSDGIRVTKYDEEFIRLELVYDLVKALGNYVKKDDKLILLQERKEKGIIVIDSIIERNGERKHLNTQVITAGGYNIQNLHYRYLVNTDLPRIYNETASKEIEDEIKKIKKTKSNLEKIESEKNIINRLKSRIDENNKILEYAKSLNDEQIWEAVLQEDIEGKGYINRMYNASFEFAKANFNKDYMDDFPTESDWDRQKEQDKEKEIARWKERNIRNKEVDIRYLTSEIKKVEKRIEKLQNQTFEDGGATDYGKIISASSRFKPMETIVFDPPLVGLNGAKLTSYNWSYTYDLGYNKREGELYEKRVSDWTQADISADTGRGIVHKYTVEMPDGEVKTVSSDSVPILLGYTDRKQSKVFPNLATASKTLAKQKLQLAILEAKSKEREDAKQAIIAEGFPPMKIEEHSTFEYRLSMDGAGCYADDPTDEERIECVKNSYIKKRLTEMGIDVYAYYNLYDLKNRIARQERKIQEILKGQDKLEYGGEVKEEIALPDTTSTYDKLKPILENQGYELNKIKMEDNTILDSDTQLNIDYFNKVKAEMGMSVLKPEVPVDQIAKEQGVSVSKVKEELKQGTKVESEHTNVEKAARAVASQHLQERIDYYDKLDQLEKSPIKKDSGGYIVSEKGGKEIAHNNADMGGILVGRRHSQGGIKGRNKGSNQHIEVEGGEIVVSSKAVGASDSHTFNGKSMSNREILSFLNTEGGGVAFKAGGETDKPIEYEGGEVILTRGVLKNPKKYEFNGRMMTSKEIASAINEKHTGVSFDEGGDVPEVEVEMSYDKVSDIHSLVDYLFDAYDLKTLPVYLRTLILHSKMVGMEIPHITKRGGVVHNNMVYGIYDYIEMHDGRIVDYFVSDFVPASHGFNHFGEYKQLPLLTEYEVKDLLEAHLIKDIKLIEYYCIKYGK